MAKRGRPPIAEERTNMQVVMAVKLRDDVKFAAARRGMTLAAYVRKALAEQVERDEKARRRVVA